MTDDDLDRLHSESPPDTPDPAGSKEPCIDCGTLKRKRMVRIAGLPGYQSAFLSTAALIVPVGCAQIWGNLSQEFALLSFIAAGITLRFTHPRIARRYVCPRCYPFEE